jgi:hypothetical protein
MKWAMAVTTNVFLNPIVGPQTGPTEVPWRDFLHTIATDWIFGNPYKRIGLGIQTYYR